MHLLDAHIVPAEVMAQRCSDYATRVFSRLFTRKGMKKAIRRGELYVDGNTATTGLWIQPGQKLELFTSASRPPKPFPLELEILFQDHHLAIIKKPPGIAISGNRYRTIQNALLHNIDPLNSADALPWPHPIHRLDSKTTGLLLVARTRMALAALGKQFELQNIRKTYRAVVHGRLPGSGMINRPIDHKESITYYSTLEITPSRRFGSLSLLEVKPVTGRTHQIRIHLSEKGNAVLGDQLYGPSDNRLKKKGLFLAATGLEFPHPATGEMHKIHIDPPAKFHTFTRYEARRYEEA